MKRLYRIIFVLCLSICFLYIPVQAAAVSLSEDEQWIIGLNQNMEYITETTYKEQNASNANNPYWTSLSGGNRPNGSKYAKFPLTEGNKLPVASAWYGQDVYFRQKGSMGKGTVVHIPDYYQLKEQYKYTVQIFNAYSTDTTDSFYAHYIQSISDKNGYLQGLNSKVNIRVSKTKYDVFNRNADYMLTDAEGNYIYDLVAVGAYTDQEPDLSGKAAWALQRYVKEGYGFLIGHDTMYGYGGVNPDPNYVPDPNSTRTPMYQLDTNIDGHWNMNWLMGINKLYTETSPYKAPSMILNMGDWHDKSTLYGNVHRDSVESKLRISAVSKGNPSTDVNSRTPTNFPYQNYGNGLAIGLGTDFPAGVTHSNQQLAYGKVWIDFDPATSSGTLVTDRNEGLTGTNNFYLTTNGNFGMMQIGHLRSNLNSTKIDECRILANTIMYLSQRKPCQVCRSQQANNRDFHAVTRIHSVEELARIGDKNYWFTYPLDGCYELTADITLPDNWKPIENFSGHFNADGHTINENRSAVFAQKDSLFGGWNLGSDPSKGVPSIHSRTEKTTGIARLNGHLNQLFGTGSNTDYSRYKVIVTGSDGKEYDCITDREGKYVISNLPCTATNINAKVFDQNGNEVTEYGEIYANIPKDTWNSNETYQLKLRNTTARAVPNQTVYEDSDVTFVGGMNGSTMPESITWQYRSGAGDSWKNVSSSTLIQSSVSAPEQVGGASPYIETRLTVRNVQLDWNKVEFRAVFHVNGKDYNTFDVKTEGAAGLLTVLERPYTFDPIQDVSVWQGEQGQFVAKFEYYRSLNDDLTVKWQFRGGEGVMWDDVQGSNIITGTTISNNVTANGNPDTGYTNTSVLTVPSNMDYDKYQFRAVIEYPNKKRTFYSDINFYDGYKGQLDIKVKSILCTKHPENIKAELTGNHAEGNYKYVAEFEYTSKNPNLDISWQWKPNAKSKYYDMSIFDSSVVPNVANVTTEPPVSIGIDRYKVKTTLTLTNPPKDLDAGNNHYYFRAVAKDFQTVYSFSGDISFNYKIDIQPGNPAVKIINGMKVYTYPNLKVYAPNGIQNFRVHFANTNGAKSMTSEDGLANLMDGYMGYQYNGRTLSAEQVQQYLRQVQINIADNSSIEVKWFISDTRLPDGFDPYSGKYFEYVGSEGVTWTTARDAANARYHDILQTSGRLATIHSQSQQNMVQQLAQGRTAWIGATNDQRYNNWNNDYAWIDGSTIDYSQMNPPEDGVRYLRILPDGRWEAALNINQINVTATDLIDWWNGWKLDIGEFGYGLKNSNEVQEGDQAGIILKAPDSIGTNTYIYQDVPMVNGHTYWIYGAIGEYGDSNGNITLDTPFNSITSLYNHPGHSKSEVNNLFWNQKATGSQRFIAYTHGNGPNITGVYGQIYHLEVVDLTETFINKGVDIPSIEWLQTNLGIFSGSKTFTLNSNQSNANGYMVEYVVDDSRLEHTEKTAGANDILEGIGVQPPAPAPKEQDYRTDTDVIFSCNVTALSPINPDNPASVTFKVTAPNGNVSQLVFDKVCLPTGESERAWVKYHIPDVEGSIKVEIFSTENVYVDTSVIHGTVERIKPNDPPDPKFADQSKGFSVPPLPDFKDSVQHVWKTYTAHNNNGTWEYLETEHKAGLNTILNIQPDERVKTAQGRKMKSGYGFNATVTAKHGSTASESIVAPQIAVSYFPEFRYTSYWRILERMQSNSKQSIFQFAVNPYSQVEHRVHFTPLWYPDNTDYTVWTMVRDMWTPVGELKQSCTDTLKIDGNVYDDWYIREVPK